MSGMEAKQGKPVRIDSHYLSATLPPCTYMVVEDLCRVIPAVSHAPLTEFLQPLQVQSHLEMPGILVQLGHTQCT